MYGQDLNGHSEEEKTRIRKAAAEERLQLCPAVRIKYMLSAVPPHLLGGRRRLILLYWYAAAYTPFQIDANMPTRFSMTDKDIYGEDYSDEEPSPPTKRQKLT